MMYGVLWVFYIVCGLLCSVVWISLWITDFSVCLVLCVCVLFGFICLLEFWLLIVSCLIFCCDWL